MKTKTPTKKDLSFMHLLSAYTALRKKKSIKERVMADFLNGILKLPVFVSTGDMMDDDSYTSMNLNFHKSITKRF